MDARSGSRSSSPVLAALREAVNVLGFDVPSSQRRWSGPLITAAKRLLLPPAAPLQRVLLHSQRRFDLLLVELLERLPVPPEALRVLREAGTSATGALAGQRRWNLAVCDFLEEASSTWPLPPRDAAARLDALEHRSDILSEAGGALRAGLPLWRELVRRQVAFNHACVRALRHVYGLGRPVLAMPSPEDYAAWCRQTEPEELRASARALEGLRQRPLISLVTPAYETPAPVLAACIESVLAQSYPHWELCIADDGSPSGEVARTVERFARSDSRIRFTRLPRNEGIARATNAAIALTRGDFIAFLDHDDVLRPHALAEVALRLDAEPDVDVLYSDEDKVDAEGRRFAPYLKPDLSPDLLRALNYVCHFLVVRAGLLREVEGIREGFDGAQDHDLILRLLERTGRFAHIPKVLYHWRTLPGSTSSDASAKPRASEAGRRAVEDHLRRLGEEGTVETFAPGVYRVRYPVRDRPRVSILVRGEGLAGPRRAWAESLLARTGSADVEVLCASESLEAETQGRIRGVPGLARLGRAASANRLAAQARGTLLLFLDLGLLPGSADWLEELMAQALRPEVGAVGGRLVGADGTLLHAGLVLGVGGVAAPCFEGQPDAVLTAFGGSHWPRDLLAVSGACLMVRREVFERLGGFDEGYAEGGEDVAFCVGVTEARLRVLYTPHARLVAQQAWRPVGPAAADEARLRERCRAALDGGDPFYNPNLSRHAASGALLAR